MVHDGNIMFAVLILSFIVLMLLLEKHIKLSQTEGTVTLPKIAAPTTIVVLFMLNFFLSLNWQKPSEREWILLVGFIIIAILYVLNMIIRMKIRKNVGITAK
ncbi:hypothetical protein [Kurthia zopfii]|uniref:hypothetical protein n=1 Tax=Kurthia zopfii TaxID=1650 RepID=UPI000F709E96|nr:hypothetical protein [Kurthia zopfii]VEI08099.1 Uncharacterised protein [Kurthia zopfii]